MKRHNRRLTWPNRELVTEPQYKDCMQEVNAGQGQEYRNVAQICRDDFRKAKAHLDLRNKEQGTSRAPQ